ncbi:unnamed protein product [Thelazia callipaeda]|uniref:AMP-binding domain-containing protein n=1 Tax=Thelazia callipaeda TaxID=103827 RepID=A0A0N5CUZ0_THECL|nr:unnamed protein product [Thelazia callipaeda]
MTNNHGGSEAKTCVYDAEEEKNQVPVSNYDKVDAATETKAGWFIIQDSNDSSWSGTHDPSACSGITAYLAHNAGTVRTSTESLSETFEAVLESLRRSLKKHRLRNTILGRTILTRGISVAVKKFDPNRSYNKLSLKRFTDERDFVGQKLNTFMRVSNLYLGRRSVKVSDLKCSKYFYESYILHECRLMSLQRPKKKPLHEYYNDDDAELEALARVVDPTAPRPEGVMVSPARGDHASVSTSLPRSIDSALRKYGTSQSRMVAAVVLDHSARPAYSLTYGKFRDDILSSKLLSRATKVAHMLLTKLVPGFVGKEKVLLCKSGDRVALVYPNTEPLSFLVAFYGCILAGIIPVPVEVPLSKRDAGIQQLGFLLGSCGVKVALTSDSCYKGLPKRSSSSQNYPNSNAASIPGSEIIDFKGWPQLVWLTTEHLSKPSRDWSVPPRVTDDSVAYIEYTTDKEGSVKGVCITRQALLSHCRRVLSLTMAMNYSESETMVSVLDFKREAGLWHSILASVFAGLRVVFVPYSLMKINPASWMLMVTKYQAKTALVKSRDLHWGLLATRDHKDINLSSLRSILVTDGANPWSLSSCDQFASVFQSRGLHPGAVCPCAGSSETGTVSVRRPCSDESLHNSGRGVLSMSALSYSVVRVDQENSLTSLTLQDAGQVITGGVVVVIKLFGPPRLCCVDEVGEICLYAHSTGSAYWGLDGLSMNTFRVEPLNHNDKPLGPVPYVRSGLLGFLAPNGLVFVVGNRNSQMYVSGRQHGADDLIATVLAVEPMKFIYRGRIAVFSINVLRDERICIVAEQKPGVSEEDSFSWMSRVLQAVDSIHQVGIYCLALVPSNQLPKTPLGGIHVSETRQRFIDGILHPTTLLMCPHTCVINLPKPREQQCDVGPAAMFVGNIVQGVRIAAARGRQITMDDDKITSLVEVLRQRSQTSPDHILFTLINSRGTETESTTCAQLLKKAERIASMLIDRGRLNSGEHVALIFPPGIDLIAAFYGCQVAGLVPVCIRPPFPHNLQTTLPTVRMIVDVSKAVAVISTSSLIKLLKCKEASLRVDAKAWPTILDVDDVSSLSKRRWEPEYFDRKPTDVCYLDFSVSTTGQLAGIVVSIGGASALCRSLKIACELYPSRHITLCLDPYCGLGLALWCLAGVYSGHHSLLIPPTEVEQNSALWLTAVSQRKVRDTFCSYGVMELCVRELAPQISLLKEKGVSLSCVRTCVVVAEERPRVALCTAFSKLFAPLGLNSRAVSTSFGCRVNTAICMQGAASPDPATVYVDARALRNDRVTLVEKGAPHSIALMESGKLLPGVEVVIANPETRGQCADSHLGEIWVACSHNAFGYFTLYGEEASLHSDHFNASCKPTSLGHEELYNVMGLSLFFMLTTGDTRKRFARTGYLGFLRQTQSITADGELHDAVFVVGALDEALMLRGMRYHPVDIEATVIRAHRKISECAVFTWTHLLVVVAETEGSEAEALDLVPAITSSVLEEHHLIVGVVVIVDPGVVPINSRGEKQRMHLRDAFLKDMLDPIYVAYNM